MNDSDVVLAVAKEKSFCASMITTKDAKGTKKFTENIKLLISTIRIG